MNKEFWKSKTLWGIAIVTLVTVAQLYGIEVSQTQIGELVRVIGGVLAAYGYRDAIS